MPPITAADHFLIRLLCLVALLKIIPPANCTEYSKHVLMDPSFYSYDPLSPIGPKNWRVDVCTSGERQSPIRLDDVESIDSEFPDLELFGHWDERDGGFILKNTGHSAEVEFTGEPPLLRGGPLTDEYVLAQLHFHWGPTISEGSEHSLDGHFFGMEAHLVHYKWEYGSVTNASGKADGLAVVGIFFKGSRGNNGEFNGIVQGLEAIEEEGTSTPLPGDAMQWLEGYADMQNYYTYQGSLTTPPCSEIVTWIVMKEHSIIGQRQIDEFKRLQGHEGEIENNVRPVQELRGRQVFHSTKSSSPGFSTNLISTTCLMSVMLFLHKSLVYLLL